MGEPKWETKVDQEGRKMQSMQIQAPSMTEEDQYGYTMPEQYRCDSCKAVVYELNSALKAKQPKSRRLHEWELQEIVDETCKTGFQGYGIQLINGQNALAGPGLKRNTDLAPGMGAIQMSGDSWKNRLGEICRKLVYDQVGEDELYEHFREGGTRSGQSCATTMNMNTACFQRRKRALRLRKCTAPSRASA